MIFNRRASRWDKQMDIRHSVTGFLLLPYVPRIKTIYLRLFTDFVLHIHIQSYYLRFCSNAASRRSWLIQTMTIYLGTTRRRYLTLNLEIVPVDLQSLIRSLSFLNLESRRQKHILEHSKILICVWSCVDGRAMDI